MLEQGLCTVTGFEPLVEAYNTLNAKKGPNETYLPYIVGDGEEHTLYLTRMPGMVSLLKPSERHLAALSGMGGRAGMCTVDATMETTTVRLDDLAEVRHVDLLKMDIQGSELMVMRNATRHLAGAVMCLPEVSFFPLYEGQPALGEIDGELRSHGFVPHCFAATALWPIETEVKTPKVDPHQLLDGDIVYVRDFTKPMAAEQWKQLAMLAHHVCASYDLAMLCVENLAKMGAVASDAALSYRKILEQT